MLGVTTTAYIHRLHLDTFVILVRPRHLSPVCVWIRPAGRCLCFDVADIRRERSTLSGSQRHRLIPTRVYAVSRYLHYLEGNDEWTGLPARASKYAAVWTATESSKTVISSQILVWP